MRNQYDEADVGRMLEHLADAVSAQFRADHPLNIVGIRTRGETIAPPGSRVPRAEPL